MSKILEKLPSVSTPQKLAALVLGMAGIAHQASDLLAINTWNLPENSPGRPQFFEQKKQEPLPEANRIVKPSDDLDQEREKQRQEVWAIIHDFLVNGDAKEGQTSHLQRMADLDHLPGARAHSDGLFYGTFGGAPQDVEGSLKILEEALKKYPMTFGEERAIQNEIQWQRKWRNGSPLR